MALDRPYLVGGEVTGSDVLSTTLASSSRIEGYPQLARRITEATSLASMAAQRQRMVVDTPSPAMAWLGERGYSFYKP